MMIFSEQKKLNSILWESAVGVVAYPDAIEVMSAHVKRIIEGRDRERIWLLEHEPCFTQGQRTAAADLGDLGEIPLYPTQRGGLATYHGPGQLVGYVMLDLRKRGRDLHRFVWEVEEWLILTLKTWGVEACRSEGRIGVWVRDNEGKLSKMAALGFHVQKWVTSHGFALNIDPDLSAFQKIAPCGIRDAGVTSLKALGVKVTRAQVEACLFDFAGACLS